MKLRPGATEAEIGARLFINQNTATAHNRDRGAYGDFDFIGKFHVRFETSPSL